LRAKFRDEYASPFDPNLDNEAARVIEEQAAEIAELNAVFASRFDADMRAIKIWQSKKPGRARTWPDHADLVVWLLGETERMREALEFYACYPSTCDCRKGREKQG
jgi:hypothetical protein